MRTLSCVIAVVAFIGALALLGGCPKPQPTAQAPPPAASPAAQPAGAPASGEDMASCPVLGTTMPKSQMIPVEHEGKTYYMCCQDCVTKFKADPKKYIEHPAKPLPPGEGMGH